MTRPGVLMLLMGLLTCLPSTSRACGTVPGWVKHYFNENGDERRKALYFIHCRPILEEQYKATLSEHEDLARMINHALTFGNLCSRDLAVKNFFMFDRLFWLQGTAIHDQITARIARRLGKSSLDDVGVRFSAWGFSDPKHYCNTVAGEVRALASSRSAPDSNGWFNLSRLRKRSEATDRTITSTNKCLATETPPTDVETLRSISSKALLKSKPAESSKTIKTLPPGTQVRILEPGPKGWTHVITTSCTKGWVATYRFKPGRGD